MQRAGTIRCADRVVVVGGICFQMPQMHTKEAANLAAMPNPLKQPVWKKGHFAARPGSKPETARPIIASKSTVNDLRAMQTQAAKKAWFTKREKELLDAKRAVFDPEEMSPIPPPPRFGSRTIASYMSSGGAGSSSGAGPSQEAPASAGGSSASVKARRHARRKEQAPWSLSPGDGQGPNRDGSRASYRIHAFSP